MEPLRLPRALALPDFPWDLLAPHKQVALSHPGDICDLSVGTPVDSTPDLARAALAEASDAHGYPVVVGTEEVRDAIRTWCRSRGMVDPGPDGVVPTIGSKEAVALLPRLLGVGPGDRVLVPKVAYPTYDIGARLAGATPVPVDPTRPEDWPDATLVWLNSPGNPDGHVLSVDHLRAARDWARGRGAVLVADECYAALPWQAPWTRTGVPSLLSDGVCEGDPTGLLVLYSLSKQSNMAGYRGALMAGDPNLVRAAVEVRKHAGLMVPAPVQHAMAIALADRAHVEAQVARYAARRARLLEALSRTDLVNDPESVAGLYLWVRRDREGVGAEQVFARGGGDSWELVRAFAALGILVAPGDFYGEAAHGAVRIALTASDERIEAAARRIEEGLSGTW
ncbi:succinyldiaminopimelate transaminase [Schaalia sp. 19OD2882]|uniref:succinyldiaminopimelate transaminase n=1 Tax=Schaalia sp. 19OD2882 TaxID=2794089 RepID=UPI001C1E9C2F|nr:succinyldiaminopimelate transaminase [Schaalia sp. 19OD2882]QWW20622.1 succinyldiaminopimelate transaminase [Schaalia sp. 19OD2882]